METKIIRINTSVDFTEKGYKWIAEGNNLNLNSHFENLKEVGQSLLNEHGVEIGNLLANEINLELEKSLKESHIDKNMTEFKAKLINTKEGSLDIFIEIFIKIAPLVATFPPEIIDMLTIFLLLEKIINNFPTNCKSKILKIFDKNAENTSDDLFEIKKISLIPTTNFEFFKRKKNYNVSLQVKISKKSFTLENLNEIPMEDINIKLDIYTLEGKKYVFFDSYYTNIDILSSKQTFTKSLFDFKNKNNDNLGYSDTFYIRCFINDLEGQYIFDFFIDD